MVRPIREVVEEHLKRVFKDVQEDVRRVSQEWDDIPLDEQRLLLAQFTRPDGTLAESWWEPDFWDSEIKQCPDL